MTRLKSMTPDCCQECKYVTMDGSCRTHFRSCRHWVKWFKQEWAEIRQAAEKFKGKGSVKR